MPTSGRIALYSHDTVGLGHIRRNLLIGRALSESDASRTILLISGTRIATNFDLPVRVDCVTLPGVKKNDDGGYASRRLAIGLRTLTHLRGAATRAALEAFDPELFIVDNVPAGANGELIPSLVLARQRGARVVLGLRDVLDEPNRARNEWRRARAEEIIRRYYSEVWVYGDPAVYDLAAEYKLPVPIREKLRFTGYLNQRCRLDWSEAPSNCDDLDLRNDPFALCLVGGGEDGACLAQAFAAARAPNDSRRVIVTGPFMNDDSRRVLEERAKVDPSLTVIGFVSEPAPLLDRAACVVAMGGYNTTCEVLSMSKPTLIVPRVRPRLEQWVRAKRLEELGRVDVLAPDSLTTDRLTAWLTANFGRPLESPTTIDMNGLSRVKRFVDQLIDVPPSGRGCAARSVHNVA